MTEFNIDKTYMLGANEGSNQKAANNLIVLHETTNVGAKNNAIYFKNNVNTAQTYVQYVVGDGGKIYQVGAEGYVAWGAGSYANANAPVQIELARTYDRKTFEKDYATFVNLARAKADQFGIPVELDTSNKRGIKTHLWVSNNVWGSHVDPVQSYLKPTWGITQEQLAHDIAHGIGENVVEPAPQTPNRDVITIKHGPVTGIAGWTADGKIIPGSNSKLVNASNWKTSGLKKINGLPMYQIATDEFIPKKYTDQANVVTVNAIAGIAAVNSKGNKLDKILKDLTQWKTDDVLYSIAGRDYFKVATDEYVDAFYTIGGGNK
ncbi:peptidoglycan recognition protein family protein [Companilactobacillus hulinensis]|uniref:peptidoglycan recognition protein family protein n=1 Tax=Companilactobacillus hulinensis TaxID=2486007 RepID=UPI0013DDCC52|nr:peptidoglycan recognition family protein [Companilactobacillus hulinensis]